MQRGLGEGLSPGETPGVYMPRGFPHERHSTQRVQSPFGTLAHCAVQEAIAPPTLIIYGLRDDVVPIEVSRNYVEKHPQAKLIELDSDHGLNDLKERIWQETKDFFNF